MHKNFESWSKRKVELQNSKSNFYKVRDVRWSSLGVNIGYEQDGTSEKFRRPAIVVRGFSRHACLIVPLTTSTKKNPYHFSVGIIEGREAFAILSQIRLIDTKRLHDRLAIVDKEKFEEIRKAIKDLI
jgi:mRNA-degrading endonuclease toxin of MazEF toxin-antitoxin module